VFVFRPAPRVAQSNDRINQTIESSDRISGSIGSSESIQCGAHARAVCPNTREAWSSVPLEAVFLCRRIAATVAGRLRLKAYRKRNA
jgi:hypothetical protein